jgi:2-dehydropantoate 2-reductase
LKIAIIGPGAMGLFFAARLQEAGHEVRVLDYRPERSDFLINSGLRLITLTGEEQHYSLKITHEAAAIGPCDLVLIKVKAHQTGRAAQQLPALLGVGGIALTLQNGIGNLEGMAEVVGPERLLAGVTMLGVTKLDVGRIRHAGPGQTFIGRPPASQVTDSEITAIVRAFEQAGLDCRESPDIIAVLWNKLLINVGINPVTALTRLTNGQLPAIPAAWEVVTAALQEAYAVAEAKGIPVAAEPADRVKKVCQDTAGNYSSMLQDVLARRRTEVQAINGQIVRHGRQLHLPTPINTLLFNLIKALETGFARPAD